MTPQITHLRTAPLHACGTVVEIAEGREIFAEGDDTDLFYKVVCGVVRVCKFLKDGRRQIAAFHAAGEVFGLEMGSSRELSAEAVSNCTLIAYRRRSIELMGGKDEIVSRQMFGFAMQNLTQALSHSLVLGRRCAAEKLAAFLLDWQTRLGGQEVFHLAMTRQEIADYLGLTIETVSRSFSQFERDHLIALPSTREVHILDKNALEELAPDIVGSAPPCGETVERKTSSAPACRFCLAQTAPEQN